MKFNPKFAKTVPFPYQVEDTQKLLDHAAFALFLEMGCGKSKITIDAACVLATAKQINTVIVVAPASVRSVWADASYGEIKKHAWAPSRVVEFAEGKMKTKWSDDVPTLQWCVTNYELLRSAKHLDFLIGQLKLADAKTLLVLDESSYVKSHTAKQSKAVKKLREHCARCVCITGTPLVNNPLDLWMQMDILSPDILRKAFHNYWHFRSKYCETIPQKFGGHSFQKVVCYRCIDDLQKRIEPYCVRRLKADVLTQLPPKLYTMREVALSAESWERYQILKKDAIIALSNDEVRLEPNAAVRLMRLAQLTSGILGGTNAESAMYEAGFSEGTSQDISDEKLSWAVEYLTNESTALVSIIWVRWRRERERLRDALRKFPTLWVREIYGGQSKVERELAIQSFTTEGGQRRVLLAQPHAGGHGLNLQVASEAIYLSNDWSWGVRAQSEDRAHRSGQTKNLLVMDVLATGPKGQPTIDSVIFKALRDKQDLAAFTCAMWRKELEINP